MTAVDITLAIVLVMAFTFLTVLVWGATMNIARLRVRISLLEQRLDEHLADAHGQPRPRGWPL